jgi:uncharacterized protein
LIGSSLSSRRRRRRWVLAGVLTVLTLPLAVLIAGPSPPRRLNLATGEPAGMYAEFGKSYREQLGRAGINVTLHESRGSIDNLERLLRGEADLAFVQGGTASLAPDPAGRLRGIAAVFLEPLWIFHRQQTRVDSVSDFAGLRIAIGQPGSGTEAVATALLHEHDIDDRGPGILRLTNTEAQRRLERGDLEAAFFVTSYRNPMILDFLARPDLSLFSFKREAAYSRKFPALRPVALPEGLLDLRRNLPAHDTTLLAPAALLVCREDLHPRVVEQILKVAQAIHGPGSLMDAPQRFPSLEGVDLPVHYAAQVYLTQGESFLSRTLPYAVVRWMLILRLLVLPAILVWVPLFRVLPDVIAWRVDRRLTRLYEALIKAEREIVRADRPEEVSRYLTMLDGLLSEAESLRRKIPVARQRDVYQWRLHVGLVRAEGQARLARLGASSAGDGLPRSPAGEEASRT